MLASIRLHYQATLLTANLILLGLLFLPQNAFANDLLCPPADPWMVMECSAQASQVHLIPDSRRTFTQDRPTFVITHGMGGTATGDRFHKLADAISNAIPECNVLIIDWSKQSWRTLWFGLPDPLAVSRNIDPVALEASAFLKSIQIDPARTTFRIWIMGRYG